MIFNTLSEKIENSSMELVIQNLEVSNDHWSSVKAIHVLVAKLELNYLKNINKSEQLQKELSQILLDLTKKNPRIKEFKFYNSDNENIILIISSIPTFKPDNFLNRMIYIVWKKLGVKLTFADITENEWQEVVEQKKHLPETWQLNEKLTKAFQKFQQFFF